MDIYIFNQKGGLCMVGYVTDFLIVAFLIILLTALNGVISNTIGEKLFGGKNKNVYSNASLKIQSGWKAVRKDTN